jgi:DNA-directed RNA polymerase beta subunit
MWARRCKKAMFWQTAHPPIKVRAGLGTQCGGCLCPWEGYNYEDAILLSEELVKEDYVYLYSH